LMNFTEPESKVSSNLKSAVGQTGQTDRTGN
jgi:hypothetical protein